MADNSWFSSFPEMERSDLRAIKKTLDGAYRDFSREYGEMIESFFDPLLSFLVWFEKLLISTPWLIVLAVCTALVYAASRSWKLALGCVGSLLLIGYFGMWEDTMRTLSIITVCTLVSIFLGIPIGIAMARSNRAQSIVTPMLDIMQTMPAFVYLIPVVMLLGIGKVPGLISVIIYAIPPIIRLTNLGIRLVDKDIFEYYGSGTEWKKHLSLPKNRIAKRELLMSSDNYDLVRLFCKKYSKKNDIVNNSEYLNLIEEAGPSVDFKYEEEIDFGPIVSLPENKMGSIRKVTQMEKWLKQAYHREVGTEEIARELDMTVQDVKEARGYAKGLESESLINYSSLSSGSFEEMEHKESLDYYRDSIEDLFETISKREADVLRLYYGWDGPEYTLEEIGEKFDLTVVRVRQIKNKALQRMRNPSRRNILRNYDEVPEDFIFPQFS